MGWRAGGSERPARPRDDAARRAVPCAGLAFLSPVVMGRVLTCMSALHSKGAVISWSALQEQARLESGLAPGVRSPFEPGPALALLCADTLLYMLLALYLEVCQ